MSKRAESIKILRQMNDDELAAHLKVQRRKLFEIRFQQATGQVENHRQIRDLRREIARTMTVQIEAQSHPLLVEPTGPAGLVDAPASASRKSRKAGPSLVRHPSAPAKAPVSEDAKPARSRARKQTSPVAEAAVSDATDDAESEKTSDE